MKEDQQQEAKRKVFGSTKVNVQESGVGSLDQNIELLVLENVVQIHHSVLDARTNNLGWKKKENKTNKSGKLQENLAPCSGQVQHRHQHSALGIYQDEVREEGKK